MIPTNRSNAILQLNKLWNVNFHGTLRIVEDAIELLDDNRLVFRTLRTTSVLAAEAALWDALRSCDLARGREAFENILLHRDATEAEWLALWKLEATDNSDLASSIFPIKASAKRIDFSEDNEFFSPDFIIAGTMKGGTSSLYNYICQHPTVIDREPKEIHYFTESEHAPCYYRRFFAEKQPGLIIGEASPSYFDMALPDTPARIRAVAPNALLIVILANPTRRAISEYYHNLRIAKNAPPDGEYLSENDVLTIAKISADVESRAPYLMTGFYEKRMQLWQEELSAGKMIIFTQNQLRHSAQEVVSSIWRRLGLKSIQVDFEILPKQNVNSYPTPSSEVISKIDSLYAETREVMRSRCSIDLD